MKALSLAVAAIFLCITTHSYAEDNQENNVNQTEKAQEQPKPQKQVTSEDKWKFAIGLGYMVSTSDGSFDDVTYIDTSVPISILGTSDLGYSATHSIILEGRKLPSNDWGFAGGLSYEGEREFDSGVLSGDGITVILTGGSDPSKIQTTTLYGSAVYRWNMFYLPLGLNYSLAKFTPAAGFTGSYDVGGGLGAQLGAGWLVSNQFAAELHSWVTALKLKSVDGTETLDYGTGHFRSLVFSMKYVFN